MLLFDGAMSEAQVYVNGEKVCFWPYGYNSFHCDVTEYLKAGENELTVLLENRPQSSRWYPGAGLYRKVRHITLPKVHVPVWGTYVTTPYIGDDYATVRIVTKVEGVEDNVPVTLTTRITDADGRTVAEKVVKTAGKASQIRLVPDRPVIKADGEDLCFINVSLTDKDGNPVPVDSRQVKIKVSGAGSFKAVANGDPTCLESFQKPQMHLFSGQLTLLVQSGIEPGEIMVEVSGKGVKKGIVRITAE